MFMIEDEKELVKIIFKERENKYTIEYAVTMMNIIRTNFHQLKEWLKKNFERKYYGNSQWYIMAKYINVQNHIIMHMTDKILYGDKYITQPNNSDEPESPDNNEKYIGMSKKEIKEIEEEKAEIEEDEAEMKNMAYFTRQATDTHGFYSKEFIYENIEMIKKR